MACVLAGVCLCVYDVLTWWCLACVQSSPTNYGAWADQSDFKPEVRKACEAQKQSSKNAYVHYSNV